MCYSPHPPEISRGLTLPKGSHLQGCVHLSSWHPATLAGITCPPIPKEIQAHSVHARQMWWLNNPHGSGKLWLVGSRHDGIQTLEPSPSINSSPKQSHLTQPRDLQLVSSVRFHQSKKMLVFEETLAYSVPTPLVHAFIFWQNNRKSQNSFIEQNSNDWL